MEEIDWDDFDRVEMRVGRVLKVDAFPEARNPSYYLTIDFGDELGERRSSAAIGDLYEKEELLGRLIVAVTNFPPKQIGPFMSECLVLGVYQEEDVILLQPQQDVENGAKVG